jgi:tetratricopeptide (TPR) repeat protein
LPENKANLVLVRNLSRTYMGMARVHRMHGDLAEALRWADRSVEFRERWHQADPGNVDSQASLSGGHYQRGYILELAGRRDAAAKAYQQAIVSHQRIIAMAPTSQRFRNEKRNYDVRLAGVLNRQAWELTTDPDPKLHDAKRAVELAKRAIELAPQEGNYFNTLGVAHYRDGDWTAAIVALEKAIELRKGGDSLDWFFLAMAHWRLGHRDEARTWFDRAIEWMEAKRPKNKELGRFRAEAEVLLSSGNQ